MSHKDNEALGVKDRSPSPCIKSTAVVKYTAVQSPVEYSRLQCNTDLNSPPTNWLSSAIDSYGLKQILRHSSQFSRMAHMFPDCVGEVDVISGAECIKTLLKIPYQPKGTVSMIVHRVENTLLLDDFNIYDFLLKSEWSWLKSFFYENIIKTMSEQERVRMIDLQDVDSKALQLTSKFLCHSVASAPEPAPLKQELQPAMPTLPGPFLPEAEDRPDPGPNDMYSRNVLWTFENIRMLIGSDLPIFGGEDRPCVSLRLRDSREPINVLTGIDYWLDNLMCNVPEVLMCYHIDGIVQKYEPMKTEDLPNLDGSKFSARVIRNVAQNILAFLKSNATKAGHTYWLFKGSHDDVVKLYDLTSICGGIEARENTENPFTTPVGMLLYRVARNMRMTKKTKNVRMLLENAIKLLSSDSHPHIVASSQYMLADLYVPATTHPAAPDFKDESDDSECDEEILDPVNIAEETSDGIYQDDVAERNKNVRTSDDNVANRTNKDNDTHDKVKNNDIIAAGGVNKVTDDNASGVVKGTEDVDKGLGPLALTMNGLALTDIGKSIRPSEPSKSKDKNNTGLGTEPASRCGKALQHALKGLVALHNVTIDKCKEEERERLRQQRIVEEQNPKMANPYEPIKMNYQPLDSSKKQRPEDGHGSRSRRRKRERRISERANIDKQAAIDPNAILILRDSPSFPSRHEPSRDDNFAWKLHLKTLLYEKICLAYAILAEHSYIQEQYGFSLKCIKMAHKCQTLLSNMVMKSRVVETSGLLGRMGDVMFQISKCWSQIDKFRAQFEIEHETDKKIRMEIEKDMCEETENVVEDGLVIELPADATDAMEGSCSSYRRALEVSTAERRGELLRRLGSVNNELGVKYMHLGQVKFMQYFELAEAEKAEKESEYREEFERLSRKSVECLDEATDIFRQVNDVANLALLYCNRGRYSRFRAHCSFSAVGSAEVRRLYSEAEALYTRALRLLGSREECGAAAAPIWDLVAWELSSHTYTRATAMQDNPASPAATRLSNEAAEVAEALKHALKHCVLTVGPRQYLYQFRAAMIHHRLGGLYHKLYRETSGEGPRRRAFWNQTRGNYDQATTLFATLEDTAMFLTVQMEHVGLMECQAATTPNLKLKSLQTALQLMRQCHSIVKLIKNKAAEDEKDSKEEDSKMNDYSLLCLLKERLQFVLKGLIQFCRSKPNKDYEEMAETYKKMYSVSLRIREYKESEVRQLAENVDQVLESIRNLDHAEC